MNHVTTYRVKFCPATAVVLATVLAGCSRQAPAPAPVKPAAAAPAPAATAPVLPPKLDKRTAASMMHALFDTYDADKGQALVGVENDNAAGYFLMTLASTNTLPDGRVLAIVNGSPSDEDGNDLMSHATEGLLNVYVLRREGAAWKVLARHDGVAGMGSSGQIGDVTWLTLGPGKPGFIVSTGGVWQGYVISTAAIFELDKEVRDLGAFRQMSSNEGACVPGVDDCWTVDSSLRLVDQPRPDGYRDLLVDFKGKRFTVALDAKGGLVQHVKTSLQQTARYRFNGKEYVLVDGTNPVPEL